MSVTPIEANRPHVTGNAQCRECAYGWVAVIAADANLWLLECPRCRKLYGHIVGAFPENPYEAKVWAEAIWQYLMHGGLPALNADAPSESPTDTDGCAGSAADESNRGAAILMVNPSRWTTSRRGSSAGATQPTTCAPPTVPVTAGEDGDR